MTLNDEQTQVEVYLLQLAPVIVFFDQEQAVDVSSIIKPHSHSLFVSIFAFQEESSRGKLPAPANNNFVFSFPTS
jgi:hypothetical protein